MQKKRIGIYAGTFDPVHSGHVAFALQSLQVNNLDIVYFLPERRPRNKQHVEHFGHRVAMLSRAIAPHPQFAVMELVDVNFSIQRTLPYLQQRFLGDELVFLFGSDIIPSLIEWPHAGKLLENGELIIGLRHNDKREDIHRVVEAWPFKPKAVTLFESYAPDVSSGKVRKALRSQQAAPGVLKSVERYSNQHWLYVSLNRNG